MREVSATFGEGFKIGLEPDEVLRTSTEYLLECYNLLPTQVGLEPRQDIFYPEFVPATSFPLPAIYYLSKTPFIFGSDSLYWQDNVTGDTTKLLQHNWPQGYLPHIADFQDFIVFCFPGVGEQYYASREGVRLTTNGVEFNTCCNFKGQLIIGDCSLPNGPLLEDCAPPAVERVQVGGPNYVAWSRIGAIDWEYNLGNEIGWMPMPWEGRVLALLQSGENICVYTENGIGKLIPYTDPTPTFGFKPFFPIGPLSRDCVAGSIGQHIFLGSDMNLYSVSTSLSYTGDDACIKKIGYSKYMRQLSAPIVTFDPLRSEWYIGDEYKCFVYNRNGLGEISETPTHLNRAFGSLVSYSYAHGDRRAQVRTSPLSFNQRGFKQLMCVESDIESGEGNKIWGRCLSRWDYSRRKWHTNPYILLDGRGAFFPLLSGTELEVEYKSEDFHNFLLSKLFLRYKTIDKTFSRGILNAGRPDE